MYTGNIILAVDPGPQSSGLLKYNVRDRLKPVLEFDSEIDNDVLLYRIAKGDFKDCDDMAMEYMVSSYGQAVADSTFRTQMWSGRIAQAWLMSGKPLPMALSRQTIGAHLTHTNKWNDTKVGAALRVRFDEPLSPKHPRGPLKGLTKHAWSACAIAVTAGDGMKSYYKDQLLTFASMEGDDRDLGRNAIGVL